MDTYNTAAPSFLDSEEGIASACALLQEFEENVGDWQPPKPAAAPAPAPAPASTTTINITGNVGTTSGDGHVRGCSIVAASSQEAEAAQQARQEADDARAVAESRAGKLASEVRELVEKNDVLVEENAEANAALAKYQEKHRRSKEKNKELKKTSCWLETELSSTSREFRQSRERERALKSKVASLNEEVAALELQRAQEERLAQERSAASATSLLHRDAQLHTQRQRNAALQAAAAPERRDAAEGARMQSQIAELTKLGKLATTKLKQANRENEQLLSEKARSEKDGVDLARQLMAAKQEISRLKEDKRPAARGKENAQQRQPAKEKRRASFGCSVQKEFTADSPPVSVQSGRPRDSSLRPPPNLLAALPLTSLPLPAHPGRKEVVPVATQDTTPGAYSATGALPQFDSQSAEEFEAKQADLMAKAPAAAVRAALRIDSSEEHASTAAAEQHAAHYGSAEWLEDDAEVPPVSGLGERLRSA